jgi:hypothetical protein
MNYDIILFERDFVYEHFAASEDGTIEKKVFDKKIK